jgi:hypothetical protein
VVTVTGPEHQDPAAATRRRLAALGVDPSDPTRRAALASLSAAELDLLASIVERLVLAGPEVEAHDSGYGGTFW